MGSREKTLSFLEGAGVAILMVLPVTSAWATYSYIPGTRVLIPIGLTSCLALLLLVYVAASRKNPFTPAVVLLAAYISWVAASYFWTIRPSTWFVYTMWLVVCGLAFVAAQLLLTDRAKITAFTLACAAGVLLAFPHFSTAFYDAHGFVGRLAITGHNVNFSAYALVSLAFCIAVTLTFLTPSTWQRVVLVIAFLAAGVSTVLLDSVGAQCSIVLMAFVGALMRWMPRAAPTAIALLLFGAALVTAIVSLGLVPESVGTISFRTILWPEALQRIAEHPVLGIGPGAFPVTSSKGIEVHNLFLGVPVSFGAVGALLLIGFAVSVAAEIRKSCAQSAQIGALFFSYFLPIAATGHIEVVQVVWIAAAFASAASRFAGNPDPASYADRPRDAAEAAS